jgi:hypothetical protein
LRKIFSATRAIWAAHSGQNGLISLATFPPHTLHSIKISPRLFFVFYSLSTFPSKYASLLEKSKNRFVFLADRTVISPAKKHRPGTFSPAGSYNTSDTLAKAGVRGRCIRFFNAG